MPHVAKKCNFWTSSKSVYISGGLLSVWSSNLSETDIPTKCFTHYFKVDCYTKMLFNGSLKHLIWSMISSSTIS